MAKFTIYQVLPRLFGSYSSKRKMCGSLSENGCGKFAGFSNKALREIKLLGITHIWYTGIIEHATQTNYSEYGIRPDHPSVVKGKAGSAYAIRDYYDVDPDLSEVVPNRMKEFENLVKRTHQEGLKVIIDFVPNHVARNYASDVKPDHVADLGQHDDTSVAFSPQNNFYYLPGQAFQPQFDISDYYEFPARATGNDQFTASPTVNDWYETVKLNYGVDYQNGNSQHFDPVPDTWLKMKDILLFWAARKVDGFRCDMAEMVPVAFWEWVINEVKLVYPDLIFIAEVYNPAEYRNYIFRGGFDYLYDKVGLYDTLRSVVCGTQSAMAVTQCWQNLEGIQDHMLNFLENHDEQRIASDFYAGDPWRALPALVVAATMNRSPFMVYFGQETGEPGMDEEGFSGRDGRTTIFDYWQVDTVQRWINKGKFDGGMLSDGQRKLRTKYQQVLSLVLSENALKKGDFYDLQYANLNREGYNPHRHYAYFRHYQGELLLIIANFDPVPVSLELTVPEEAFRFLQLKVNQPILYRDLLKSENGLTPGELTPDRPFKIEIEASGAVILQITKSATY